MARPRLAALLLLGAIGVFHALTFREGHDWGDDFAMYIFHARNLAEGRPYAQTPYLFNPDAPELGPRAYPPVFPLLLAPLYALLGLDLSAFKFLELLCLLAGIAAAAAAFAPDLRPWETLLGMAILGFNPHYFLFKNQVVSDLPFLFFLMAALAVLRRGAKRPPGDLPLSGPRSAALGLLAGLLTGLACGTRTLGILVLPALWLAVLRRPRREILFAAAASGAAGALAAAVRWFLGPEGSYLGQFAFSLDTASRNLGSYGLALAAPWANGASDSLWMAFFLLLSGLAAFGYAGRLRSGAGVLEIFPLLYAVPLLLYPLAQGHRYLVPIFPFFVYYVLLGARRIGEEGRPRLRAAALSLLLLALAATYGVKYSRTSLDPILGGVLRPEARGLFNFAEAAPPDAVFVFAKPRAFALFTGRRSAAYHRPFADPLDLWRFLRRIGARYVVDGPVYDDFLARFIHEFRPCLSKAFSNGPFTVYRIEGWPPGCAPASPGGERPAPDP